ncbi:MAG TPA: cytochrome c oxidase accessory protein CcoG [Hyphomicrobium sp.]|nr:cytochrome c oxidase accessory protein CcoG [Hyphomicrobium sp.]
MTTHTLVVEAAHGVEKHDVDAVNAKEARSSYAGRQKIYPKRASGSFRNIKWIVMAVTMGVYYLLPWVRWERGPGVPDQAFLIDMAHERLYFFWFELWPQELYLITGFLVMSALALFLFTAIAGRVWCGYLCWQTVWTDLMVAVERFWQGDRNARIRLDKEPWSGLKLFKKAMTHVSWLVIAAATGGAFILYFRDAPTLVVELFTGQASMTTYLFFGLLTFFTYLMGGIAREQVCIYMCPWPRIQGAMLDQDSLFITYRDFRGEPRGPHRKGQPWEGRGDCIDCKACIAVCPMGIDIRHGPQLECIQCGLCIDACNEIMTKIDRPQNLIAYDTYRSLKSEERGGGLQLRLMRPRTMIYAGLLAVVASVVLYFTLNRTMLGLNAVADRNPLFVTLSDGSVRNTFTLRVLNKKYEERTFKVSMEGLEGARLTPLNGRDEQGETTIVAPADDTAEARVAVTVPKASLVRLPPNEIVPFTFKVQDATDGSVTTRAVTFRKPR